MKQNNSSLSSLLHFSTECSVGGLGPPFRSIIIIHCRSSIPNLNPNSNPSGPPEWQAVTSVGYHSSIVLLILCGSTHFSTCHIASDQVHQSFGWRVPWAEAP